MEEIGNFLSNEYGLIKHIFKYLPNRDLYRARHVCRSWKSAVDIMMEKKPVWAGESTDNFDRRIRPKIILVYDGTTLRNVKKKYTCSAFQEKVVTEVPECNTTKFCTCKYIDEETVLCVLGGPMLLRRSVAIPKNKGLVPLPSIQCSSMLMLPEIPGVEFSAFSMTYEELIFNEHKEEMVDALIGREGGPLKCLLLFTSYQLSSSTLPTAEADIALDILVAQIEERVKHRFALGGGILKKQHLVRNGGKSSPDIMGVVIKGENVTAHSQILIDHDPNTDGYMKELADRLGPAPEDGKSRLAFIVQCVNKDRNMMLPNSRLKVKTCDYELSCFAKYFPSVPIFGFMGYGEFGLDLAKLSPYGHEEKKKKTRSFRRIEFADSTSIVVVTFNQRQLSSSGCDFYN